MLKNVVRRLTIIKKENSHHSQKKIVVFGAGIAGLTVAHEFAKRGYKVNVYEINDIAGGFFRSARLRENNFTPSEYSWHGIAPWYHNLYSLLKEIPFDEKGPLFDYGVSRPIDFGIASNNRSAVFDDSPSPMVDVKEMFHMSSWDKWRWAWIILRGWCANKRSFDYYSTLNAKDVWGKYLSSKALDTWSASFGPWIGSDYCHVSLHQAVHFFRKQLINNRKYHHRADEEGQEWTHGARSGWLLLKGPSNEIWFDKWCAFLEKKGVDFFYEHELHKLNYQNNDITSAVVFNKEKTSLEVKADIYILALNPFSTADILDRTPGLNKLPQLNLFRPLIQSGPHTQVSLRLGFSEKIFWPRKRCALVIADSAFDLTMFAQEQVWYKTIFLGKNIQSLWTVTACVSKVPGPLYGLALENCTKEQFIEEVLFQLKECQALDRLVKEANSGRSWKEFPLVHIEIWHEWTFSPDGIRCRQPKWVNSTSNQKYMPRQKTTVNNLALAGAHTQTTTDVWSIEAAVESGLLAVKNFEPDVEVIKQYNPWILKVLGKIDDVLYFFKLPNVVDVILIMIGLAIFLHFLL